ncbi:MAG: cupin domain-containing protein [Anaerolineae bacterium]|nr:cupin domain-containing protein [Anaerolineae bacterium]
MDVINLAQKFALFSEAWQPRIVGQINEMHIKLARLQGEFIWHHHPEEDEVFWVISGRLRMQFRDREVVVEPGELLIVPHGVEHRPVADAEVQVVLIERASTRNTGTEENERTAEAQWL